MKRRFFKLPCLLLAVLMACALLPTTALAKPQQQTIHVRVNVRIWTGRSSVTGRWTYDNPSASYGPVSSLTTRSDANGGITVTDFSWSYTDSSSATFTATATASGSSSNKWGIYLPSPDELYANLGTYEGYKWASSLGKTYASSSTISASPYWSVSGPTGTTLYLLIWMEPQATPTPTPSTAPTPTLTPSTAPTSRPEKQYYWIDASAEGGGTISPDGTVLVREGGNRTFVMAADPGCVLVDVLVDGTSIGPVSSYTFRNVQRNHTIHAVFSADPDVQPPATGDSPALMLLLSAGILLAAGMLVLLTLRRKSR